MPSRRSYRGRKRRYTRRRRAPKRRLRKKARYGSRYKSTMGYARRRSKKVQGGMHIAPKYFARRRKRILTFKTQPLRQTITKLSNPTLAEVHPLQARLVSSSGAATLGAPMTVLLGTGGASGTGGSGVVLQINSLYQPTATIDWFPAAVSVTAKRPTQQGQPMGRDEMFADFKHGLSLRQKVDFYWDIEAPASLTYAAGVASDSGTTMDLAEIMVGYMWRFTPYATNSTSAETICTDVTTVTTSTASANRLLYNPDSITSIDKNVFMLGKNNLKHSPFLVYRTIRLRDLQKRRRVHLSTDWVDAQQLAREAAIEGGANLSLEQVLITQEDGTDISHYYYAQVVPFVMFPSSASAGDAVRFDFHYEHQQDTLWTAQNVVLAS